MKRLKCTKFKPCAYTDDGYLDVVTNPDAEATKHEYLTDGRLKKITVKNNQNLKN